MVERSIFHSHILLATQPLFFVKAMRSSYPRPITRLRRWAGFACPIELFLLKNQGTTYLFLWYL